MDKLYYLQKNSHSKQNGSFVDSQTTWSEYLNDLNAEQQDLDLGKCHGFNESIKHTTYAPSFP